MSNDDKKVKIGCPIRCNISNRATINYDYVIENEVGSNKGESNITSTCIKPTIENSFSVYSFLSQRFVKRGDIVTCSVVVSNTGNTDITNINLTSLLDDRLSYVSNSSLNIGGVYKQITDSSIDKLVDIQNLDPIILQPSQNATFTFKVEILLEGDLSDILNQCSINTTFDDTTTSSKDSNVTTLELKYVQLEIEKFVDKDEVECGDSLQYTIEVRNESLYEAKNIVLTDYMDREFSFDISNIIIKDIKAEPIVGAVINSIQPNGIKVEIPTIGPSETVVVVIPGSIICC